MPGRDLMVRIRADVTDFRNKMRLAQGSIADFDKQAQKGTTKTGKALNALGLSYRGVGVAAVSSAATVGGAMVKAAADFDQGMSNVKATGADAVQNIDALRKAALDAGADTKFSATEAAGGVEALAKAGIESADILKGGLAGALDLAAAGNLDVAGSAEAAAAAMSQFGLQGRDVPHIADLLAAGAGKANGEVSDMAQALNQAGLVAAGAGASIEETTGTLAAFAQAGLLGSDAGTSLKTMLQRLQNPLGTAKAEMQRLGISAYDAKGNFVGMENIAAQLRDAFKGQTDEARNASLAIIFGSDAVRAANVLYKEGGTGIRDWTTAVNDSGYAADVAATKMDNLKGDLETLRGSIETLLIKGGGGSQGPLRTMVQDLTDLTNAAADFKAVMPDGLGSLLGDAGITSSPLVAAGKNLKDLFQTGRLVGNTKIPLNVAVKISQADSAKEIAKIGKQAGLKDRQILFALKLTGAGPKEIKAVADEMQRASRIKMLQNLGYKGKELKNALADLEKIDRLKPKKKTVPVEPDKKGITKLQRAINEDLKQKKKTPVSFDTARAQADAAKIQGYLDGLKRDPVYVGVYGPGVGKAAGGVVGFAGGGIVPGIGPSNGADNVAAQTQHGTPYAIRSGEWIINERQSRLNDRYLRAINSGADFNKILPGFSGGGRVPGAASGSVATSSRFVSGQLRIDPSTMTAYIEGVAQDVVDGNASHAASRARAGAR